MNNEEIHDHLHDLLIEVKLSEAAIFVEKACQNNEFNANFQGAWGDTVLMIACGKKGAIDSVASLLKWGCDVNIKNNYGCSALMWALAADNFDIADLLLQNGADPFIESNRGETSLSIACSKENSKFVRLFLREFRTRNPFTYLLNNALGDAIVAGNIEIVELLLAEGAEINSLHQFCDWENNQGLLSPIGMTPTKLQIAIINNDIEMVKYLLSKNAEINQCGVNGDTAIATALAQSTPNFEIIKFLINSGADLGIKNDDDEDAYAVDSNNNSVLRGIGQGK